MCNKKNLPPKDKDFFFLLKVVYPQYTLAFYFLVYQKCLKCLPESDFYPPPPPTPYPLPTPPPPWAIGQVLCIRAVVKRLTDW